MKAIEIYWKDTVVVVVCRDTKVGVILLSDFWLSFKSFCTKKKIDQTKKRFLKNASESPLKLISYFSCEFRCNVPLEGHGR